MNFENEPLRWENEGIEPTEELKNGGWQAQYKPPADFFNYKWNNDYNCLKELQEKLNGLDDELKPVAKSGSYNDLVDKPKSLPANGGNADTVDGLHSTNINRYYDLGSTQTNINNVLVSGIYKCINFTNYPSDCADGQGILEVKNYDHGNSDIVGGTVGTDAIWLKQYFTSPHNGKTYERYYANKGISNWSRVNDGGNADTAVKLNHMRLNSSNTSTSGYWNPYTWSIFGYSGISGIYAISDSENSSFNGIFSVKFKTSATTDTIIRAEVVWLSANSTPPTLTLTYVNDTDLGKAIFRLYISVVRIYTRYTISKIQEVVEGNKEVNATTSLATVTGLTGEVKSTSNNVNITGDAQTLQGKNLSEIQNYNNLTNIPVKCLAGETVTIINPNTYAEETIQAQEGATIVGDLRPRTYVEGNDTTGAVATGLYAVATGSGATAKGKNAYAQNEAYAEGDSSAAMNNGKAIAELSAAMNNGKATAELSAALNQSTANGYGATAMGYNTEANGDYSTAMGYHTTANDYQNVFGRINKDTTAPLGSSDTTGSIFIVGCGTTSVKSGNITVLNDDNAFRITSSGVCYGKESFKASGADFAEYFEWKDGNPNNDDRRGLFVTLDGEKIRLANADDDYILGVVSATPTVTGDTHSETWKDMYLKDVFGEPLKEVVTVPESKDEKTGKIIPEHTETRFVLNPDYDPSKEYTSRDKRSEWSAIGLVGKLIVVDDGTCEVNGYCKCGDNGIAIKSDTGYRVLSRIDETHIKILIK